MIILDSFTIGHKIALQQLFPVLIFDFSQRRKLEERTSKDQALLETSDEYCGVYKTGKYQKQIYYLLTLRRKV